MNNNNWIELVFKFFVPLSFFAIWAITALFNRESKGFVPRPPAPGSSPGVRPGDPNLRWGTTPTNPQVATPRRVPLGDDDILILPSEPNRPARVAPGRSPQQAPRRSAKGRPAAQPPKKVEPAPSRNKLSGVNQNVNQQLARPMDLTPLTTIAPMATSTGSELATSPSAPSKTSTVLTISTLIPLMNDPIRLREAFIVNELFQKPLALRGRQGQHR